MSREKLIQQLAHFRQAEEAAEASLTEEEREALSKFEEELDKSKEGFETVLGRELAVIEEEWVIENTLQQIPGAEHAFNKKWNTWKLYNQKLKDESKNKPS